MRVNMDSSMVSDPRFRLVAERLGLDDVDTVFGKCFRIWLACYERRSKRLRRREADMAARLPGFADALIAEELADADGDCHIVIHGVEQRISFLEDQTERGRKGGKESGKSRRAAAEARATAMAKARLKANGSSYAKANTPTPTPTPTPANKRAGDKRPTVLEIREFSEFVITHLNGVTGRGFPANGKTNLEHARKLLSAGFTMEQVKAVIDAKWAEWGNDPKMSRRVCPDTLFPPTKMRKYLDNDVGTGSPQSEPIRKLERLG